MSLSVNLYVCKSVCLPVWISVCLWMYICLNDFLSEWFSVWMYVCLNVCRLNFCLSVFLSVCLMNFSLSVCLSECLTLYPSCSLFAFKKPNLFQNLELFIKNYFQFFIFILLLLKLSQAFQVGSMKKLYNLKIFEIAFNSNG